MIKEDTAVQRDENLMMDLIGFDDEDTDGRRNIQSSSLTEPDYAKTTPDELL